jgi:hypothetical protein
MQRISGATFCLLGLTAVLLLFAACGQNEGGRCQVTSDCASGLTCSNGSTGNGTCGYPANAQVTPDAAPDVAIPASEVGAEAVAAPEIDAATPEAGPATIDAGAVGSVDSDSVDLAALD